MEKRMCKQEGCKEPATRYFLWPGDKEKHYCCFDHASKAVKIGSTLGVYVPVTELEPSELVIP